MFFMSTPRRTSRYAEGGSDWPITTNVANWIAHDGVADRNGSIGPCSSESDLQGVMIDIWVD